MNDTLSLERDIFISYAHIDNKPLTEEQKGWVSAFDSALKNRLPVLLGRKADIWRDQKLKGDEIFADEIVDQFPKLKVMVSIVSPRYLESDWCRKELEEFYETANRSGGVRVGNKSRIFKIVKTPVPQDKYPKEISNVLGYEFFESCDDGHFREFILEKGSSTYYKFIERFEDVAQDLCQLIKMLDSNIRSAEPPPSDPKKTIYLAKTTSDLEPARDNIRRDLEKRGYTVFPDQELPIDDRFRQAVEDYLQRCRLAVHLIGNKYGLVPEDEQHSMVEIQCQLSQSGSLSRLIWLPDSSLDSKDPRQQDFIDALQHRSPADSNTDLLDGNLEDLKTVIIDTLKKPATPETPPQTTIPRIYLMYDESDRDAVTAIDDYLFDQGFEMLEPVFEGDENDIRRAHQDNLKICDAVLVYYNQAPESWLKFKMNDLRKAPGYRDGKPIRISAVYIGGEPTRFKERFRSHEVKVIKQNGAFSEADLTPFAAECQINQGGTA